MTKADTAKYDKTMNLKIHVIFSITATVKIDGRNF